MEPSKLTVFQLIARAGKRCPEGLSNALLTLCTMDVNYVARARYAGKGFQEAEPYPGSSTPGDTDLKFPLAGRENSCRENSGRTLCIRGDHDTVADIISDTKHR